MYEYGSIVLSTLTIVATSWWNCGSNEEAAFWNVVFRFLSKTFSPSWKMSLGRIENMLRSCLCLFSCWLSWSLATFALASESKCVWKGVNFVCFPKEECFRLLKIEATRCNKLECRKCKKWCASLKKMTFKLLIVLSITSDAVSVQNSVCY